MLEAAGTALSLNALLDQVEHLETRLERAERLAFRCTESVAAVVQELRSPVMGIIDIADRLGREAATTDRLRPLIATLTNSAMHQLSILDDVAELATTAGLDTSRLHLMSGPVDLLRFLRETADVARSHAKNDEFKLSVDSDLTGAVLVELDGPRLRRVLLILLAECVQSAPEGHTLLRVTAVRHSPYTASENVCLRFDVANSGRATGLAMFGQSSHDSAQGFDNVANSARGSNAQMIASALIKLMGSELQRGSRSASSNRFCFELNVPIVSLGTAPAPLKPLNDEPEVCAPVGISDASTR